MADVKFHNAFALLVGVGGRDFQVTVDDATDIYKILIDPLRAGYPEENVSLLTEEGATRQALIETLDQLVEKTNQGDDATVFIYYSGHGGQYKSNDVNDVDGYEYFLKTWGHKENDPEKTMLNGKIFSEKIAQIKAKRLIILLDCCHAAGIKERGIVTKDNVGISGEMILSGAKLIKQLTGGKGRVFISSCDDNETSAIIVGDKNSLFTQVILEALGGAASGGDALVRVIDLMYHVLREVPRRIRKYNHNQNPVINEVVDLNPDYFLCRNGKPIIRKSQSDEPILEGPGGYRDTKDLRQDEYDLDKKMDFIREYKTVVKVKIENNQNITNYGEIEKQINVGHIIGNIIINNYATNEEKKAESAAKLFDIKMLVATGDTKRAIERLLQVAKLTGEVNILNKTILLAGRFNRNEKQIIDGEVTKDDANVEKVLINRAALSYLDDLELINR